MSHSYRKTSFRERRNPVIAAILAVLPFIGALSLYLLSGVNIPFSAIYGGLGMLYVGRWRSATLVLVAFNIVVFVLAQISIDIASVIVLVRIIVQSVVLPIWAVRACRQYNDLADALETEPDHVRPAVKAA